MSANINTGIIDEKGRDWPAEIYFPTEGWWCRFHLKVAGMCCIIGWVNESFHGNANNVDGLTPARLKADHRFVAVMRDVIEEFYGTRYRHVDDWNDKRTTTDAMRTQVWNETAKRCGYQRPRAPKEKRR